MTGGVGQGCVSSRRVARLEELVRLEAIVGGGAAIRAAASVGLLELLAVGAASVEEAAEALGLDERPTRRLLEVLVTLGVVSADPHGRYRLTLEARTLVDGRLGLWDALPDVLRRAPSPDRVDRPAGAERHYPGIVGLVGGMKAEAARRAAEHLARPHLRVLDLAAGAAPWSLAVVAKEPSCRVTAVDLPAVIPATRKAVEAAGRAERCEYVAGDIFDMELPSAAFDLAILGSVCHLFGPQDNQRLLLPLLEALRPEGTLAIIDILREGPAERDLAIYALGLLIRAPEGDVYPLASFRTWLMAAGLEAVEAVPLTERPPLTLVIARRPRAGNTRQPGSAEHRPRDCAPVRASPHGANGLERAGRRMQLANRIDLPLLLVAGLLMAVARVSTLIVSTTRAALWVR